MKDFCLNFFGGFFALNERGQEFAPFELFIGAIMALLILVIILGVVSYLNDLRFQASFEQFVQGFQSASNSPNGDIVKVENIAFSERTISSRYLSEQSQIVEECISFQSIEDSDIQTTNSSVSILKELETTVFIQCLTSSLYGKSSCNISCLVSFGKDIS